MFGFVNRAAARTRVPAIAAAVFALTPCLLIAHCTPLDDPNASSASGNQGGSGSAQSAAGGSSVGPNQGDDHSLTGPSSGTGTAPPTSNGCMSVTIQCVDNVPGGATALANRTTCTMMLSSDMCSDLGVMNGDMLSSEDLDKVLAQCKKDDLGSATSCCTAEHEKKHLDDGPKPHSCETEQNGYGAQKACLEAAKAKNCGSPPVWDNLDCGQVDTDLAHVGAGADFNACVCAALDGDGKLTKAECAACLQECQSQGAVDKDTCQEFDCQYCDKYITNGGTSGQCG